MLNRVLSHVIPPIGIFFLLPPRNLSCRKAHAFPSFFVPVRFRGFLLSEKKINKILQGAASEELGYIAGIVTGTAGFPYLRGVFFRANGVGPLRLGDPQLEDGKAEWQAAIDLINAYAGLNGKKMNFESCTCYPSLKGGFRERWLCCSLKRKVRTAFGRRGHQVCIHILCFLPFPTEKPECHFRLKLINILPADLVVRDGPAFPPDVTPGIYIEEIGLRAYKDEEGTGGVGHNHDEATVFGDVIPSVVLPSAWIDSFIPLYKSLDDVPFLVKDNFSILSQALFDTDGGSTYAYACLRGHSVTFYHYMQLRSITDVNLFDTIRRVTGRFERCSFSFV